MVSILCLVLLGLGFEILGQLDQTQTQIDGVCTDNAPKEAPFSCYHYAKLGLCHGITDEFCRKSCERCDCSEARALFCDVEGLTAFKNSFWQGQEYLKSWQGDDPCDWEFITCDPKIDRVVYVEFELTGTIIQDSMWGSLVPDLSKLRYLSVLNIQSVYLNGELPLEYSILNKLEFFVLDDTHGVNGTFPAQYSLWSQIQFITISYSQVTGTIPIEFSLLTSIKMFEIIESSLHGNIPPNFSTWKQLQSFALMNSQITGTLSKEFSEWNQVIQQDYESHMILSVAGNKLNGSLPQEYSNLSKMRIFGVNENRLRGSLPIEYSSWVVCEIFGVYSNQLIGTLPVQYSKMKRLKLFYLSDNNFWGWLPKEYSTMIRLKNFKAFDTNINKHIPQEWSKLLQDASINITTKMEQQMLLGQQQQRLSP